MTVVETDRFLAGAAQFWKAREREELVLYLLRKARKRAKSFLGPEVFENCAGPGLEWASDPGRALSINSTAPVFRAFCSPRTERAGRPT